MSDGVHPDRGLAPAARLRAFTPARVGLRRTGVSLETSELLDFQRCHAQARDAVHSRLEIAALAAEVAKISGADVLRLHSAATDRATYLQRPDLGRMLDEASRNLLARRVVSGDSGSMEPSSCKLSLIVADGLSALGVERHAAPLLSELIPQLDGWVLTTLCVVEQGRVAIGDEVGLALGAQAAVVLIGERPGLSSHDSLSAYITWEPRPGRTDAERNCISNIRAEGLNYAQACAQLGYYLTEARHRQLTGVALKHEAHVLKEG